MSATEDELGGLHKIISTLHNLKASTMLKLAIELQEAGDEESLHELLLLINNKDLSSIQKWVEYNQVSCQTAEDDETSELSKKLKKLKESQSGKVVQFDDISNG